MSSPELAPVSADAAVVADGTSSSEANAMPELPDVEVFRRRLRGKAYGKRITTATLRAPRLARNGSAASIKKGLEGNRFRGSRRHGKNLLIRLDRGGWLLLHFGMSGSLEPFGERDAEPGHTRMRIDFGDGTSLAYTSIRMLGRIDLVNSPKEFVASRSLGPDALDRRFDLGAFEAICERAGTKRIKALMMDQSLIAGIGNIYADEILFRARVHPSTPRNELSKRQLGGVFRSLKTVLGAAIEHGAGSEDFVERLPPGFLLPERRRKGQCPRCGTPLETLTLSGRKTYYCPRCQHKR
jgi:formamidopyrimidine-DNA glycosylase